METLGEINKLNKRLTKLTQLRERMVSNEAGINLIMKYDDFIDLYEVRDLSPGIDQILKDANDRILANVEQLIRGTVKELNVFLLLDQEE